MMDAPLVVVPLAHEAAYRERYAKPDKAPLKVEWPVPYWYVDTGMAALCMLLTAVDEGLGACFFGIQADHRAGRRRTSRIAVTGAGTDARTREVRARAPVVLAAAAT